MGNYRSIKKELTTYIRAQVPLIIIDSTERERVERLLRETAKALNITISYYTPIRQVVQMGGNGTENADGDPLGYIAEFFKKRRNTVFALSDNRRMDEERLYSREMLDLLYLAAEQTCTLIVVTPDPVWTRLSNFGMVSKLDYPDLEERTELVRSFIQRYAGRFPMDWSAEDVTHAAMLLRGFTEIQIKNVLSAEVIAGQGLFRDKLSRLTSQKSRLFTAVPCIQQVEIPDKLHVSGLENLKDWLEKKKKLFFTTDEVLSARALSPPKGILLTGIPGCGKSYSAKMIAHEWEMPLFRFDIGGIFDKWMGESERKMRDALRFIDNVAPCVVWIDEIEKALSVSDDGNDTGKRVLGQFLFWLQESDSRVFLVATANDISRLPPELFRKGRFSGVFFIDLPCESERRQAIAQYAERCLNGRLSDELMDELARISEGFSYADIENEIKEAAQDALLFGEGCVTDERLLQQFYTCMSYERANPDSVARLRAWAQDSAINASYRQEREEVLI